MAFSILIVLASIVKIAISESLPCTCGVENIKSRIYGGEITPKNAFPWMTLIQIKKRDGLSSRCAGAIINDRYILTAGHCLVNAEKVEIVYGTNKVPSFPFHFEFQSHIIEHLNIFGAKKAEKWIVHESFNLENIKHDIGLIKTKEAIKFSKTVSPICLPKPNEYASGHFTVAGWGLTEYGKVSDTLLQADVLEYNFRLCNRAFNNILDRNFQICAAAYGKDTCEGDSGAPLMKRSNGKIHVAGVSSFGNDCGKGLESVYTRVNSYLDWIYANSASGRFCAN